jgi:hypothetical protein
VKIYLSSPSADGQALLVYDQPTTSQYQSWRAAFPECANGSCPLDLRRNGVSCIFEQIDCTAWVDDVASGVTYTCWYGTHLITRSECNIYGDTVNATRRSSGHGYSDPTTGATVAGQTSTSRVDELARALVAGGRTWVVKSTDTIKLGDPQTGSSRGATARALARQCVALGASDDECETLPIFSPGSDIPAATSNDLQGLAKNPDWVKLNYADDADRAPDRWYQNTYPCTRGSYNNDPANPEDCDEFPYFSTLQGGPGAQIAPIPSGDNRKEGSYLGVFYSPTGCNVPTSTYANASRVFLVLPTPTVHTSLWCNATKD